MVARNAFESVQTQFDILSTIDHPGVIHVHDVGRDPELLAYLITEYVEPVQILRDRALRPDRAMQLVAEAADALQAVHERDVVYRNIRKGLGSRSHDG